jgi:hypothetical protein
MDDDQLGVFWIVDARRGNEVFEQQEIPRTALHDG